MIPSSPPPPAARPGRYLGPGLLISAPFAWLIWLLVPQIPVTAEGLHITIQEAHGLCGSSLVQLGPSPGQATADCGHVSLAYDGLTVMFWGGLLLAAAGAIIMGRRAAAAA